MKISLVDRSQYQVPIALLFIIFVAGMFAVPWIFPDHQKEISLTDDRLVKPVALDIDSRIHTRTLRSPNAQGEPPVIEQATILAPNLSVEATPAKTLETSLVVQAEQNEKNPELNREQLLINSLNASEPFRVRVNAALELGNIKSVKSTRALIRALEDSHSAVRAAAESSLKRIGTTEALTAAARLETRETVQKASHTALGLAEAVQRSTEPLKGNEVRRNPVNTPTKSAKRYSVHIGAPRSYIAGLSTDLLSYAHGVVTNCVGHLSGVRLVSEAQASGSNNASSADGRWGAYSLDLSITRLEKTEKGIRAAVSVVLSTHPGKNIRATLRGAAAAPKRGSEEKQKKLAIDGAIRSTLSNLRQVMAATASRR